MDKITMCGYKCELCKAYAPNIKRLDERDELARIWNKYYDLNIKPEDIYCEGCRCKKEDAKRIDNNCPVRGCVLNKKLEHCGECDNYPCNVFLERKGLSCQEAKAIAGFSQAEYDEYLLAYDNKTRIDEIKEKTDK